MCRPVGPVHTCARPLHTCAEACQPSLSHVCESHAFLHTCAHTCDRFPHTCVHRCARSRHLAHLCGPSAHLCEPLHTCAHTCDRFPHTCAVQMHRTPVRGNEHATLGSWCSTVQLVSQFSQLWPATLVTTVQSVSQSVQFSSVSYGPLRRSPQFSSVQSVQSVSQLWLAGWTACVKSWPADWVAVCPVALVFE